MSYRPHSPSCRFFRILIPALLWSLAGATFVRGQAAEVPELERREQERLNRVLARAAEDAEAAMEVALEVPEEERDARLWRWIGDQRVDAGQVEAGMEAYAAALERFPTYRDVLLNYARASMEAGCPGEALPALQRALAAGLRSVRVLEALAMLAEAMEDAVVAEGAYREILLLQADHGVAREGLARALLGQERFGEAERITRQLLERHPDRAGLWRLYADLAQQRGDSEASVRRLETAVRLGAAERRDRRRLMELYTLLDRPLEVLRVYRAHPGAREEASLRLRLAEGLLGLGHLEAARELIGDLAEAAGEDRPRLARVRGRIHLLEEEPEEAAALLERALEEAPLDAGLLRLAGEAWMQAERPGEAVAHFERLARQPGHQARGLWLQGVAEARAGNPDRGVELLEEALRIEELPGLRRTLEQLRRMKD